MSKDHLETIPVDLVTFTEETLNGKLHFLRSDYNEATESYFTASAKHQQELGSNADSSNSRNQKNEKNL